MKFAVDDKLVSDINKTHKSRAESEMLLKTTTAECFLRLARDGRPEYMNLLYSKASTTDQTAIRVFFCNRVIDHYGVGGHRDQMDGEKWVIRPHPFFYVSARPDSKLIDDNGNPKHFGLVNFVDKDSEGTDPTKNRPAWLKKLANENPAAAAQAIADMKAFKKAVVDAGAKGLVFDWITKDQSVAIRGEADLIKIGQTFVKSLERLAKAMAAAGMTSTLVENVFDAIEDTDFAPTKKQRKDIRKLFDAKKSGDKADTKSDDKPEDSEDSDVPAINPSTIPEGMAAMGEHAPN